MFVSIIHTCKQSCKEKRPTFADLCHGFCGFVCTQCGYFRLKGYAELVLNLFTAKFSGFGDVLERCQSAQKGGVVVFGMVL